MKKLLLVSIGIFLFTSMSFAIPANCVNPQSLSAPFSRDGAGEFCFAVPCMAATINSWNMEKIEINGVDFTNRYADGIYSGGAWPAPLDGKYYIYYKGFYAWSHFEMTGTCSSGTPVPVSTPAVTPVPGQLPTPQVTASPGPTPVIVPTAAPTPIIPTAAPTPVSTPTNVPTAGSVWLSPSTQSVSVGDSFTVEIHVNTGTSILCAFGFTVTYPTSIMSFHSMSEITQGLNITTDSATAGRVNVPGFNALGIPAGTDVALVRITFTAIAPGTGYLGLTVQNLMDINGITIGTPNGSGAMVMLNGSVTPIPTAVSTPSPTPLEIPTAAPTDMPTALPTPAGTPVDVSAAAVWLSPASQTVNAGDNITIEIHVNTGNTTLGAFGFTLTYPLNMFTCSGIAGIADGLTLASNTEPGKIVVAGFNVSGIGPGSDIPLVRITLVALSGGTAPIGITIQNFVDAIGNALGAPTATGATVTIMSNPTPEPTSTEAPTAAPAGTLGDINGDGNVDIIDALLLNQYYVGLNPSNFDPSKADVNADGVIDFIDAILILQGATGEITLPTGPSPLPVPGAGSFTLSADSSSVTQFELATLRAGVDTGAQVCAAYSLVIAYPPELVSFDSITAGATGFVSVVNAGTPGMINVSGIDMTGKGPGVLELLTINLVANNPGSAAIALTPDQLIDANAFQIGTPQGASVNVEILPSSITPAPTIEPATPVAEPTPTPEPATISPTVSPTPGLIPGEGNVWFEPSSYSVNSGDAFSTFVHVNTGDQLLGAYAIDILFDKNILKVDTSLGDNAVESDGSGYVTYGTSTPGLLKIGGFDTNGKGPSLDLSFLTIHWIAIGPGTSPLGMTVSILTNVQADTIGLPSATNGSVTVNLPAGETATPVAEPTPTPLIGTGQGNIRFYPSNQYEVNNGDHFETPIHLDSGGLVVGAYQFTISYPDAFLNVDTSIGNSGVEAGTDGFVVAVNPNTAGSLVFAGFDVAGRGPGTDLDFVRIHWKTVAPGVATIVLSVDTMVDLDFNNIILPNGVSAQITIR